MKQEARNAPHKAAEQAISADVVAGVPPAPGVVPRPKRAGDAASAAQGAKRDQRLFRTGTCISSGLISRTSSGTPQANAGSFLILKWYMLCMA